MIEIETPFGTVQVSEPSADDIKRASFDLMPEKIVAYVLATPERETFEEGNWFRPNCKDSAVPEINSVGYVFEYVRADLVEAKDARIADLESHSWFVRLSSDNADLRGHIAHDSERRKMLADEFDLYDVLPESDAGYDATIKRIIAYLREGEQ